MSRPGAKRGRKLLDMSSRMHRLTQQEMHQSPRAPTAALAMRCSISTGNAPSCAPSRAWVIPLARTLRAAAGRLVALAPFLQQTRSPFLGQGSPQPKQNSWRHRHVMWLQPELRSTSMLRPGQICISVLPDAIQAIIHGASEAMSLRWELLHVGAPLGSDVSEPCARVDLLRQLDVASLDRAGAHGFAGVDLRHHALCQAGAAHRVLRAVEAGRHHGASAARAGLADEFVARLEVLSLVYCRQRR